MPYNIPQHLTGLTENELNESRRKFGYNKMVPAHRDSWLELLAGILKEPMLVLLFAISIIYLIVGDYGEASFMFLAIVAVSAISFYQDNRSKKALAALEKLNEPLSIIIRNGNVAEIPTQEIAVGDLCIIEEGKMINADGKIVHSNDFSVNEASLTGESLSVFKSKETEDNRVFSGTVSVSGLAVFEVEKIGKETRIGKIGISLTDIKEEISPLQLQITKFVKGMAAVGFVIFLLVCAFNYYHTRNLLDSLLNGLTLAMSVLPEEIPVAFTTFMALGAWKLMRDGIIIKRSSVVETLGSTTVICTDKTGTITENSMSLKHVYDFHSDTIFDEPEFNNSSLSELIAYAMWSSEPVPFDPMEKALHQTYQRTCPDNQWKDFQMIHEYPLEGNPPMMTHLFRNSEGKLIVAAKGAPEAIINVSSLSEIEKVKISRYVKDFGKQGFRVLGVAKAEFEGSDFPEQQQDFSFYFLGLVVFSDPPKAGIQAVFQHIYDAGIKVKVITGDNTDTTNSIAQQAGIINTSNAIEGKEIMELAKVTLQQEVNEKVLFTRMFPDAKLTVVRALKQNGEVVAMLGDGVNDAPALKAAHIGVAMGKKGTEIAKAAASLVIIDDDLDKLVIAIAAGRRIYTNIKKAVQYIISIHIPIILTVSLPLFLGWVYPQIFTPVHVIFLELIMGPTCSIVYENEPMEKNTMLQKPRNMTDTFLNWKELAISIVQGLVITAGVLFAYQYTVQNGGYEGKTRAMVFTTLIFANIFLSLTNRSFRYSVFESLKHKNSLFPVIIGVTVVLLFAILYVPPFAAFFKLSGLNGQELGIALLISAISVLWFEVYKVVNMRKEKAVPGNFTGV
ncbi:MAG: cation-translocating P-type ATPase [Chitinophagaceae bacterium]|nr:cation-translocating P-type ATPase [Chitinophagaceae bacterium]